MTVFKIFVLLMLLPIYGLAQVNISAQIPTGGLVGRSQLWNLTIVNSLEEQHDIFIRLEMQDASNGQSVLSAVSSSISLGKGIKMVNATMLQPIIYNPINPDYDRDPLLLGSYVVCYQIFKRSSEIMVSEECVRLNIDPLSPPLLTTPLDGEVISGGFPQFTWMPPTPTGMFRNLSYELLLTEVFNGQASVDAIQSNVPVYFQDGIRGNVDVYPLSVSPLDTGKTYAWQVVARNDDTYAAKSEVWTFRIAKANQVNPFVEQFPYLRLSPQNPDKGIAPNGILKLAYLNESTDSVITVFVKELGKSDKSEKSFVVKVNQGENLVRKDIRKLLDTSEGKVYEAFIFDQRRIKWQILFEVLFQKGK